MAYPVVASLTETAFSANSTDHNVDMPATVNAGDLLIIYITLRDGVPSTPTDWTEIFQISSGTTNQTGCYAKVAVGDEGGSTANVTTAGGVNAAAHCYRITGWFGSLDGLEDATATGSGTAPDPPNLAATWGLNENLWLVCAGGTDDDIAFNGYPTNYTNGDYIVSGGGGNDGAEVGSARRNLTASSDNPGTFTLADTESWTVCTLVIRPVFVPIYGGMLFDSASTQYLASVSSFTPPAEATVCFWMRIAGNTGEAQRIMGCEDLWEIGLTSADPAELFNDLNQSFPSYIATQTFATNTWFHITCTAANTDLAQIYVDGLFDSDDNTATGSPGADTLRIGHRTGAAADEYFNGYIEDMRIYDRVLSANEIFTIYSCKGLDGIVHGLLHRWLMNEGPIDVVASGAGVIKDLAIGQLNMTPNNSPIYSGTRMKYKRMG